MTFYAEYQSLFERLTPDTQVITANQRMARFVSQQWNLWQQQTQHREVWPSLACAAMQVWIADLWSEELISQHSPYSSFTLLNKHQEHYIWSHIVEQNLHHFSLLSSDSVVGVAIQAWKNLRLWNKTLDDLEDGLEETAMFKQWVEQFTAYCTTHALMDEVDRLVLLVRSPPNFLKRRVVLVGFDNVNPLESKWINTLEQRGIQVEFFDVAIVGQCGKIALPDNLSELQFAARWAAAKVAAGTQSVGIVIPDLANKRVEVESVFTEVFEPQSILPWESRHAPGFNMSAAQPLAQTRTIAAGFLALKLNGAKLDVHDIKRILLSPFLFLDQELPQRIQLAQILVNEFDALSLDQCVRVSNNIFAKSETPQFILQLRQFLELGLEINAAQAGFTDWANVFNRQLNALSWPGERTLDTLEYQQLTHWPELMSDLCSLDSVNAEPVTFQLALKELNLLAYRPFHPQTESSPVQVLGMLEAAGLQFDCLWVMGLDYRVWPEACNPNPLLPTAQQKQWQMPRASGERELFIAEQLTERLAKSAKEVIMSYPCTEGDQPLRASPLLDAWPILDINNIALHSASNNYQVVKDSAMEWIVDERAAPVTNPETVRGGSQILKNHALCPFKAFAEHRLRARNTDTYQPGVTAIIRGDLIHKSLELIWQRFTSQAELLEVSSDELTEVIKNAVAGAWTRLKPSNPVGEAIKNIELNRAVELLRAWMEIEKQRPEFVVFAREKSIEVNLGGMPLNMRCDRIDSLKGSDEKVIIDYKTGKTDIKKWFSARPEEPQVPLYALADKEHVVALAFAQINRHEVALNGVCAEDLAMPGFCTPDMLAKWDVPNNWLDILDFWRTTFVSLSRDFLQGNAAVDPKNVIASCRYCELHSLCRVREAGSQEHDLTEDV